MTAPVDLPGSWQAWNAQTWGQKLFDYFFVSAGGDTSPVPRLAISAEDLVRAGRLSGVEAHCVREAFLRAVRCPPDEFRRYLSRSVLVHGGWPRESVPPFAVYLFFTCFTAASIDAETFGLGDFRKRLRVVLEHPRDTSYALTDLPDLWRAFERWLANRRQAGTPYRALVLPEPGYRTLIGYSVGLAFPSARDQGRLVSLIRQANWTSPPTIPEALDLIGRGLDRFSPAFRDVFDSARRAFGRGTDTSELHALWSAVVEATTLVPTVSIVSAGRARYELVLQVDEMLRADLSLLASQGRSASSGWGDFTRLDEPIGDYAFLVRPAPDADASLTVRQLLRGTLVDLLPDLRGSPVARACEQGVLLFRPNVFATWELAQARPEEGMVRALVATRFCEPFLALFGSIAPSIRESIYHGWLETAPFEASALGTVDPATSPALVGVRCLQATSVGSQIALAGGVRVDGGYLGTQGLLPSARMPGAQSLELFELSTTLGGLRPALAASVLRRPDDSAAFEFPQDTSDLEGRFTLVATGPRDVVASRELVFHSRVLDHRYKDPGDSEHWMVEAARPAVLPASVGVDAFLAEEACSDIRRPHDRARPPPGDAHLEGARPLSIDDDPKLDRFVEALAALATNRKGLGEAEVLDLLDQVVGIGEGRLMWDVLRAWVEAGYLDVLTRRRWRGRVYFARRPCLVVTRQEPCPMLTLHGLAPYRLRVRARSLFASLGATPIDTLSVSRTVGAPPAWVVESHSVASIAAEALELGPLRYARPASELLAPLSDIAQEALEPLPGYERQGVWDWDMGGFHRVGRDGPSEAVRIEWRTRADRPDLFLVTRADGTAWSTHARNWALLVGYAWAKRRAFEASGESTLLRGLGPYLPLPVARAMVLRAGATGGPTDASGTGGFQVYAYPCSSAGERARLLRWLDGRETSDADRRLAWLLASVSHPPAAADTVPLPLDVVRRLREIDHPYRGLWRLGQPVSRRLLPQLRRAISKVGA